MSRRWVAWGLLGIGLGAIGCQGSTPPGNQTAQTEEQQGADATSKGGDATSGGQASKPPLPVLEGVDSFEGTWVLAPSIQRATRFFWMFRLTPAGDGQWKIEDVSNEPMFGSISGVEAKIDGPEIRLEAQVNNPKAAVKTAKLSFEGTLRDGAVWGNLAFADAPNPFAARLLPTDAESLADYANGMPDEGHPLFDKATREPDPSHGLWKVAKEYPQSPLALEVYQMLFSQIAQWNFSEDEARAAVNDFRVAVERWGKRLQASFEIDAGLNLARARKFIDVAEELLNDGENRLPDRSELLNAKLKGGRINVRIARGLAAIQGKDADAAAAAYADLQQILADQPHHPEVVYALAEHAAKTGQTDAAIGYYLTIVSLPSMDRMALASRVGTPPGDLTPKAALEKLWSEKHGSLDGLEGAIAETYDREIGSLLTKIREAAPALPEPDAGNRTVLVELFTGAACDPCVAADLALEGLTRHLPTSEVIQISYHTHIPAPDPLASIDGEGRAKYYNVEGTPSLFMNGQQIPNVGGFFTASHIEQSYHTLRLPMEFFLKQSTEVVVTPQAEAVDGKLKVNVAVSGVPDDLITKVRLRVAVVEDQVEFVAPNGIRHHRMVVRTLLGGPGGKAANKDKVLEYSIAIPLAELKARQVAYMAQVEHGKRVTFSAYPAVMKPLHVVAFVQNDATKEVLQAAATSVTGELKYPEFEIRPGGEVRRVPDGSETAPPQTDAPADAASGK